VSKILNCDVLEGLKQLPDNSVQCCITSPPYWGLRDYGTAKWEGGSTDCDHLEKKQLKQGNCGGLSNQPLKRGEQPYTESSNIQFKDVCAKCGAKRIDAQIGLESTPEAYVAKMVEVFREVRRVLRDDGTLWLNLGDTYHGGGGGNYGSGLSVACEHGQHLTNVRNRLELPGLKPKDLVGIPWRVAFALQADGWYLRQDIIWHKPNPMPESVTDRCTKSHEYIFLLAKSQRYYYDADAIKEQKAESSIARYAYARFGLNNKARDRDEAQYAVAGGDYSGTEKETATRNKRSVWTIATKSFSEAHFATFPEALVEPMIKAGTSERGNCPDCGMPWERQLERTAKNPCSREDRQIATGGAITGGVGKNFPELSIKTIGWQPSCTCGKQPTPAIVLDPFFGAGTTGLVAQNLGREYIGIELNPEYVKIADERINHGCKKLDEFEGAVR